MLFVVGHICEVDVMIHLKLFIKADNTMPSYQLFPFCFLLEQLHGFQIYITNLVINDTSGRTPYYIDEQDKSSVYNISVLRKARYVRLVVPPRTNGNTYRPIVLCEVEIWGRRKRWFVFCLT